MELEPADGVLADQVLGAPDGRLTGQRIHRAERNQHVGVGGGPVGHLLAGQRRMTGRGPRVHGEYHGRQLALPVVVGDLLHRRRPVVVGLEVFRRCGEQLIIKGELPVPVGLDVDVHVDTAQRGGVRADHCNTLSGRSGPAIVARPAFPQRPLVRGPHCPAPCPAMAPSAMWSR